MICPLPARRAFRKGHLMMVRHNNLHPQSVCQLYLGRRRNTVIAGDNQFYTIFRRLPDQMIVQTVTVPDPVRDRHIRLSPQGPERAHQNISGTDTVYVVIPDHPYFFVLPDSIPNNGHRPVHPFQQFRRIQVLQRAVQIFPDILLSADIPVANQPRKYRRYMKFLRYFIKIRFLRSYKPVSHLSSPFHPCFFLFPTG